jgi:DNA polymerase-3 subunit chi
MPEFRFHRLERKRLDQALPELLEAALAEGARAVVQAASTERVEALNEHLWTYSDDSFLPHGAAGDGEAEAQPIYLTDGDENPNGATLRVLLPSVDAISLAASGYATVVLLFENRDEDAVAHARRQWTALKAAGARLGYWREGDNGGWVQAR